MSSVARGGRTQTAFAVMPAAWRSGVDTVHFGAASLILVCLTALVIALPRSGDILEGWAGGALLVGGAFIGLPHGASDFIVAHRVLRRRLRHAWLPTFLLGYLALVAIVLEAWSSAPLATLVGFLAISAIHFGSGDTKRNEGAMPPRLLFAVRATTPLLPIFLLHPSEVAPLLAMLGGVAEASVIQVLGAFRVALLVAWIAALSMIVVRGLLAARREGFGSVDARDGVEVLFIAGAAVVLPSLLAFGLYFCLVHAIRHLIDLADQAHPRNGQAALGLAFAVTAPSAMICLTALAFSWNGLVGMLDTQAMLVVSLKVIAALTVPHMLLEAFAANRPEPQAAG